MGGFLEKFGEAQLEQAQAEAEASRAMGEALTHAAEAVGRGVSDGAHAVAGAAVAAGHAAGQAVVATGEAVSSAITATEHFVANTAHAAYDGAVSAYNAVSDFFGPKVIGARIEPCPDDSKEDRATQLRKKIERLDKRKNLIAQARSAAPGLSPEQREKVLDAANRLQTDNKVIERARLAEDVYTANDPPRSTPPVGWTRLSDDPQELAKFGLSRDYFAPTDSQFRAALYRSDIDGSVVVAYKGTTFSSLSDWKNNGQQALGFQSDYYDRSIKLAQKLSDELGTNFETTGHSLGGGLSSAGSVVAGVPGTTFNAAGLQPNTIARAGGNIAQGSQLINAYHVSGEILTGFQENKDAVIMGGFAAAGAPLAGVAAAGAMELANIAPAAIGQPHTLPAVDQIGRSHLINNPAALHGMNFVINGLEKEKADDQQTLQAATASAKGS